MVNKKQHIGITTFQNPSSKRLKLLDELEIYKYRDHNPSMPYIFVFKGKLYCIYYKNDYYKNEFDELILADCSRILDTSVLYNTGWRLTTKPYDLWRLKKYLMQINTTMELP